MSTKRKRYLAICALVAFVAMLFFSMTDGPMALVFGFTLATLPVSADPLLFDSPVHPD